MSSKKQISSLTHVTYLRRVKRAVPVKFKHMFTFIECLCLSHESRVVKQSKSKLFNYIMFMVIRIVGTPGACCFVIFFITDDFASRNVMFYLILDC